MNDQYKPIDGLVSEILGITNFIGKILFNRNSILIAAAISLFFVVLVFAF